MNRWLKSLGLDRPELRAWAMYDWANSAMVCVIITAVFPYYYSDVACQGMPGPVASRRFALVTTIGMSIIAVLSPVLGTIADFNGRKKGMLGGFLALGAASSPGCSSSIPATGGSHRSCSSWQTSAPTAASSSMTALLPHIARDDEVDRVSTAGYALGYLGGGVLLAFNLAWILKPGWFGLPSGDGLTPSQATLPARLSFLSVSLWWVVFSIPMFRRVPEPSGGRSAPRVSGEHAVPGPCGGRPVGRDGAGPGALPTGAPAAGRVSDLQRRHRHDHADGGVYASELKFDKGVTIASILLVQFIGIPFAFLFGMLAGRIGAKRSIAMGLVVYAGICVFGYLMKTEREFLILAVLVGMVQGGTQALSRSLFATLIPRDKSGEFFGFFGTFEKFAGIFGPGVFYVINLLTGTSRYSILAIIGFFVVGGALLAFVDVAEGQRRVRAKEEVPDSMAD